MLAHLSAFVKRYFLKSLWVRRKSLIARRMGRIPERKKSCAKENAPASVVADGRASAVERVSIPFRVFERLRQSAESFSLWRADARVAELPRPPAAIRGAKFLVRARGLKQPATHQTRLSFLVHREQDIFKHARLSNSKEQIGENNHPLPRPSFQPQA